MGCSQGNAESSWGGVQALGMFHDQPQASRLCSGSNCHLSNQSNKAAGSERLDTCTLVSRRQQRPLGGSQ